MFDISIQSNKLLRKFKVLNWFTSQELSNDIILMIICLINRMMQGKKHSTQTEFGVPSVKAVANITTLYRGTNSQQGKSSTQ